MTQTIEFLKDVTVRDGSGQHFAKGYVAELSEASARHWLIRGLAKEVQGKANVAQKSEEVSQTVSEVAEAVDEGAQKGNKGRKS